MLLRLICRSGGGPPLGWPRTIIAPPDSAWEREQIQKLPHNEATVGKLKDNSLALLVQRDYVTVGHKEIALM